jgi:hypothetical protein
MDALVEKVYERALLRELLLNFQKPKVEFRRIIL